MYAYTNTYIHAMTIGEKGGHIFEIGGEQVDRMVQKEGSKGKFFVIKIQYQKINNTKRWHIPKMSDSTFFFNINLIMAARSDSNEVSEKRIELRIIVVTV